jgi:hypothetical protein
MTSETKSFAPILVRQTRTPVIDVDLCLESLRALVTSFSRRLVHQRFTKEF